MISALEYGDSDCLIEARGLTIGVATRCLLADCTISVSGGENLVLLGPNGAGKTTLLTTLAGLRPPDAGSVWLQGRPYASWRPAETARCRGLLAQQQLDSFPSTVLETVLIGRHPHLSRWQWEGPQDEALAMAALSQLGLEAMAQRNVLTLSGGERQRVAIAALLAQSPRLFMLDEPIQYLDLHYQIAVLELLAQQARTGAGIVMVLHDINLAARFADRVALLDGRGGISVGDVETVLQAERLSAVFGYPLRRHLLDGRVVFVPE